MAIFSRRTVSWMLYDWASSPVPTLHATFIFSVYFTTQIMPEQGSFYWSQMTALAAITVGVLSPFVGRLADIRGGVKPGLMISTGAGAVAVALLWYALPSSEYALYALIISGITIFCVEIAFVFYNSWLASVAPARKMGEVSGYGWALGYIGAIVALVLVLVFLILPEEPVLGIGTEAAAHVRAVMICAGLWLIIFSLPLFLLCPAPPPVQQESSGFFTSLRQTVKLALSIPGLGRFLLARMAFTDGLITLFAFGGIYAAKVFDFSQQDILIFAISLNLTAGLGAALAARLTDRLGTIRTIRLSLIGLILCGCLAWLAPTASLFWGAGLALGIFVGPAQSAARAHIGMIAPAEYRASLFGLFMFSGKITSFVGPLFYGWLVLGFGTERAGMGIVILLLILGLVLLPGAQHESGTKPLA